MSLTQYKTMSKVSSPLLGCTVLIGDKNPSAQKPLKDELNALGVRNIDVVTEANDFVKAYSKEYDLVFLDSHLSDKRPTCSILEETKKINKAKKPAVFVISNERSSSFLQSLLEHEPDEFVIKPYSTEELSKKIVRCHQKRKALALIDSLIVEHKTDEAVECADRMAEEFPQFKKELFKKKIDAYKAEDQFAKAEAALRRKIVDKAHPWMEVSLAEIMVVKDDFDEAEAWLRKAVNSMPEYTKSSDALAMLMYSTNKLEEALLTLEALGVQAHSSVERLRFMAGVSGALGKTAAERNYLQKAMDRAGTGGLACEHDYHRLSELFVEENRVDDAINLVGNIKIFAAVQDVEISVPIVKVKALLKEGAEGRARETLFAAIRKMESRGGIISPGSALALAGVCAKLGKEDTALKVLKQTDLSSRGFWLRECVNALIEKIEKEALEKPSEDKEPSDSVASRPAMEARGGSVNNDLAKRAKGVLGE